ncbi:unnamed protein product [Clonostachys byssicola]|uniref:Amidase domain-containing protein n=1 Tax=Clonostachys byssicola TaxID=160290 RepID=A0A9N9U2Z4_9HYPO|nr:unnamed protein product [Clonostachys byssicola]
MLLAMKGLAIFALLGTAASQLVSTGASFKIKDVDYFVSPYSQGKVVDGPVVHTSLAQAFGFAPVTVVADNVDTASLGDFFKNWTTKDDVWQPGFLSGVFLVNHKGGCISKKALYDGADSSLVFPLSSNSTIPSGPYFLHLSSGELFQAFRLYRDTVQAFSAGLLQSPAGSSFQPLSAQVHGSDALTIGVPSRLYFKRSAEKPLAGVRVGIKELYDLAGLRKSNGNRAWWRLYPEANSTAPCIQNLIDAGAIIVGYQKLSQFANGETATADWVDYHSPFNPRGDGYNQPSSSSSGAGASVASYEWLDIAVGSDTGGSIRGPAGQQGLFGNRPSKDLVTLDGAMPLSPTLDTPGFLVRDPEIWDVANKAMYGDNYTSYTSDIKYPTKVYTYGFDGAQPLIVDFADKLAGFVGVGGPEVLDLAALWNETGPVSDPLSVMLRETYAALIGIEQIKLVRDPFYVDYAAAYEGRRPFVNPVPLSRWAYAEALPKGTYEAALQNKTTFMNWFNTNVLPRSNDNGQCSESILLYPSSSGTPSPRNRYSTAPGAPLGFSSGRISVFAEVPDNVFPLGEVATNSSITGQDELLPVAVSLLVAKGCDGILPRLAKDLVEQGVLKIPQTGRTLEGGEILLRRNEGY